ncbi:helix-turn-helix domain-containing protein, partial [Enterococcus cecorum]|uniref:helix-turn-helix domain-containing protein n=2 Tax=Enterococcus cecorum TaxID=44008 RepID=UPI00200B2578
DMYPLYWTNSKEGIFMRYSYEYKRKCVEMYRKGILPDVPKGISEEQFRRYIRIWIRIEEANGTEALKHKNSNKKWSAEEKLDLVAKVIAGESIKSIAISAGISNGQLYQWVRKYKIFGYNGLINKKKGRKAKSPDMKKIGTKNPPELNESEYEELIRLRAETEYLRAENEVIKKEIALREEKEAARLKAKKQRLSRNSTHKDLD